MSKNIVGSHAEYKQLESNILQISQEAKEQKRKYKDVIDATVGMLHHENGNVFKFEVVEKALKNLSDEDMYNYASVRGKKTFTEGVLDWVFDDNAKMIREDFKYSIIPTTGGSGAISNTFYNFNDFGQKVLLPNYYWSPYNNFALEANVELETYKMYDDIGRFNIPAFREKAFALAKEQGRLCTLINDPCNNPTGLCMEKEDWVEVIKILNEIDDMGIPVILIHDIAYIDYQMKDVNYSRETFSTYKDLNDEILTVVVYSGSKSFSLYGFRVGAQIGVSKSQKVIDNFTRVGDYSVRGRFSSVSSPGMNVIDKIYNDEKLKKRYKEELEDARKILKDRAALFLAEADRIGLEILPYCGGFFISMLTENKNIFNDLKKDHAFVIPMQGLIRVAISSLPLVDIPELVRKLKKHV
ncbi:MAG: aminotransferase class I/II-fold pyridoxal phosphate-dependent enzyme [Candidatus Izimaplasma sp.]|nr:aminotransferase class I/II-fold pyridoxal phosphate-dependent enzyme [Candidatus Izimaplasma bacterium]